MNFYCINVPDEQFHLAVLPPHSEHTVRHPLHAFEFFRIRYKVRYPREVERAWTGLEQVHAELRARSEASN